MQLVAHIIISAFGIHFAQCKPFAIDVSGKGKHTQQEEPSAAQIDKSVLKLNRHIFKGNVLQSNAYVKRWAILFCLPWYPPCQAFQELYNEVAKEEQDARNTDIWMSEIRFAQVDCAVDKVLCNEMDVDMMPLVALYEKQDETARFTWRNHNEHPHELLNSFLSMELAKDEVRDENIEAEFGKMNPIVLKCFSWFETMWLCTMRFLMDQDIRTLVGTIFISLAIWVLMKVLAHRAPQEPRRQCDAVKLSTLIPHYMFLSSGSQGDAAAFIYNQASSIGSCESEELHGRTHTEQPSKDSGSILL